MFDTLEADSDPLAIPGDDGAAVVPLERLEAQICELARHLSAATCRFLVLLGDFDARRGWASWEMNSCAAWLSWKCQMGSGTAREHVRVARALRGLPVIRGEFGAGRLSYAKVRALTRIATPDTEAGLAELAGPMTGNQLERFARAHRQVSSADDAAARIRRRLAWRFEDNGSLAGTFRLPPLPGAVLLKALRAAAGDPEHPPAAAYLHGPGRRAAGDRRGVPGRESRCRRRPGRLPGRRARRYRCHHPRIRPRRPGRTGRPGRPGRPARGRFRGNAGCLAAAAGAPRRSGALPRRGRPGDQPRHRADDRLLRDAELDIARQRRESARPGPPTAAAERGAAPRGPRTGHMPVPVPRL